MSDTQQGGEEGQGLVPVQATPSSLSPTQPAKEEEVELASSVGEASGREDTVMWGGGLDHFLQALHHLSQDHTYH